MDRDNVLLMEATRKQLIDTMEEVFESIVILGIFEDSEGMSTTTLLKGDGLQLIGLMENAKFTLLTSTSQEGEDEDGNEY